MLASIYYPFHAALNARSECGAFGRQSNQKSNYSPPYNLQQLSADQFQLDLLVAGYQESEIALSVEGTTLVIEGKPAVVEQNVIEENKTAEDTQPKPIFLRHEWAVLPFKRAFSLESHLQVESAKLSQGVLSIFLKREIPQEKKPKIIPINTFKN